ncbi:hypothetical protein JTB14_036510 [Gonioctena quinquepunctata]|nr:hypothetical protein JTB14_036510 [Gonioctena quinquepunctata]
MDFPLKTALILLASLAYASYGHHLTTEKFTVPELFDEYKKCFHGICYNTTDYPERRILETMKNRSHFQGFFGMVLNASYDINFIANRGGIFGAENGSTPLCTTIGPVRRKPRVMKNINNKWKYVINVKDYEQFFESEICRFDESLESSENSTEYCHEYGYRCQQSYQEAYLLTFEYGYIDFDKFNIPTTCDCSCKNINRATKA